MRRRLVSVATEFQRNRIEEIFDYGLDTEHFTIYLQGVEDNAYSDVEEVFEPGVEFRMANRFIRGLDVLEGMDSTRPITVSMKTCGGMWEEGMAIYDALMAITNPITIVNYTWARSMSSIILQAANKRVMMPHSTFMFHMGTYATSGTLKQVKTEFEFSKRTDGQMLDIYVDAMKRGGKAQKWGRDRIRNWLISEMDHKEDVNFTAKEAIEWGFADEIFVDWHTVTEYTKAEKARFK
jgi:ATP-dependent protease ClpP protease subunit